MLLFRARSDLGAMAMKGYSAFPQDPALLEPHHKIVKCHIQDTRGGDLTPQQKRSRNSTAPADWAIHNKNDIQNNTKNQIS